MEDCKKFSEKQNATSQEPLANAEINEIQARLRTISRPTWHRGPPTNLGDAEHGKLKAEQWRTAIEFDLPVILFRLWTGRSSGEDSGRCSRMEKLAHSTMLLAIAIRWGTSHVTSDQHAHRYKEYMRMYLESLREVFPDIEFRPNHHMALHLDDFLRRYGPLHGWWMFPFERIIGCLQKTKTNHKIGEYLYDRLFSF